MPDLKIIFAVSVFFVGLAGGGLSRWLEQSPMSARWFSLGSALAGGVFLGAGLIHLLPDAAHNFSGYFQGLDFPLAFTLCAAGFLAVLLLEKVVWAELEPSPGQEMHGGASYLLAGVLSFHSLLAGLALGAETSLTGSVAIFLAIVAHKGSAGFALGVSLHRAGLAAGKAWTALILFACSTPLGILGGAGLAAALSGPAGRLGEAIFDSLAAGTFLYIAVLDIIQEEFFDPEGRWSKFALLALGLIGMAVLALWL